MTNKLSTERAIEALYTVRAYYASLTAGYPKGKDRRGIGDVMCSEIANSCLMAIQALEQQPSEDCISRAQSLHACCDEWNKDYKAIMKSIRQLPSVTPQQPQWIPVSERLPEERNHYLITVKIDGMNGCKPYYEIQTSWYSDKQFVIEYIGDGLVARRSVVAWMPLPEPYTESGE